MNVLDSLANAIAALLQADTSRVLLGEDVADGGMLGLSRVCRESAELSKRLISTPLVPAASIAHAAGLAAESLTPILLLPSVASLLDGYSALCETVQLYRNAQQSGQLVMIAPSGPGFGLVNGYTNASTAALCCIPELRVICLGQAAQAVTLVTEAGNFAAGEQPTVVLLPRSLLLQEAEQIPVLSSPFANAEVLSTGSQATVFAWGAAVEQAAQAIAHYNNGQNNGKVGLVDVRTLAPLDVSTLVEAAQQTGKLIIVQEEGSSTHGTGAELAALFAEHAILQLDAPILRVMCKDAMIPSVEQIALAIHQVVNY